MGVGQGLSLLINQAHAIMSLGFVDGCLCEFDLQDRGRERRIAHSSCPAHPPKPVHSSKVETVADIIRREASEQVQQAGASLKDVSNLHPRSLAETKAEHRRQMLEALRAFEVSVTQLRVAYQRYDEFVRSLDEPVATGSPSEARASEAYQHARAGTGSQSEGVSASTYSPKSSRPHDLTGFLVDRRGF